MNKRRMIQRLKEATAELHKQIEGENLARFIMDHSIDRETYELLLVQNYMAYKKTELEIRKFIPGYRGEKFLKLEADLKNMGIEPQETPYDFRCKNTAEAFGAAYVVEGSALGGMVISRNIPKCENLTSLPEQEFFSGDRQNLKAWEDFKEKLSAQDFSREEVDAAVNKTKETFEFFGKVFRSDLTAVE